LLPISNLVVVAAYGPTNCAAGDEAEEERDQFYHQLESLITKLPRHNVVVVAGDINARVGSDSHIKHPTVAGPHAYHDETNENGLRLVNLCEVTNLCLSLEIPTQVG
jgi:exonuclease III